MVLYFSSTAADPPATLYMGKDKFESQQVPAAGSHKRTKSTDKVSLQQTRSSSNLAGIAISGEPSCLLSNMLEEGPLTDALDFL